MIKYFCDRCGKEIKDTVYTETDTTEAVDCLGNIVSTFTHIMHYCDECKYEELTCGFKVGDKVITSDGRTGTITDICHCDKCKKRGFYEPTVEIGNHTDYITISDKESSFSSYYSIGDRVFGNLDEEYVTYQMNDAWEKHNRLIKQLGLIKTLKEKGRSANEI